MFSLSLLHPARSRIKQAKLVKTEILAFISLFFLVVTRKQEPDKKSFVQKRTQCPILNTVFSGSLHRISCLYFWHGVCL
ncbi:hypothetical protein DW103_10890 [Parabacteroides sp. AM08-6]|nr:hypothetical protein DW103_10890 [Parabacteroides sp. AM08-6]